MRVLVIPEDFRKDQYILKPLVRAMMRAIGEPKAIVEVCQDPLLGGIDQALSWSRIADILDMYRWNTDLFLLCVDRDGKTGRSAALRKLEKKASSRLDEDSRFFAENAWQEVEVWVLAGHDLPTEWTWHEVRDEVDLKEVYFLTSQVRGAELSPSRRRHATTGYASFAPRTSRSSTTESAPGSRRG